jgi:hypothetical protein
MTRLLTRLWRRTIEGLYAATRALPARGGAGPLAPRRTPWALRKRAGLPRASTPTHPPQHVNPAKRLERGHPKR